MTLIYTLATRHHNDKWLYLAYNKSNLHNTTEQDATSSQGIQRRDGQIRTGPEASPSHATEPANPKKFNKTLFLNILLPI